VIYVTNFRSGKVEVYDNQFKPVTTLPAGELRVRPCRTSMPRSTSAEIHLIKIASTSAIADAKGREPVNNDRLTLGVFSLVI
jgi:hypothetical protein